MLELEGRMTSNWENRIANESEVWWDELAPLGEEEYQQAKDFLLDRDMTDEVREYQERVMNNLRDGVRDFLKFSDITRLMRLIVGEL
jgi:hypothetical protein